MELKMFGKSKGKRGKIPVGHAGLMLEVKYAYIQGNWGIT
jgi:hypothetical protein